MTANYLEHLKTEYFEQLYELETNSPDYCLVQGELVEELSGELGGQDHRIEDTDAMHVAQYLNRGLVEEAEELTEELLE